MEGVVTAHLSEGWSSAPDGPRLRAQCAADAVAIQANADAEDFVPEFIDDILADSNAGSAKLVDRHLDLDTNIKRVTTLVHKTQPERDDNQVNEEVKQIRLDYALGPVLDPTLVTE
jgi:hypothetical protein